jgi:hypothetical protein
VKRITTGNLAKALRNYRPVVTDDMVRVWAERGLIPADRNPGCERGWWFVLPDGLGNALMVNIHLSKVETEGVLRRLGLLDGAQLHFFSEKKSEYQNSKMSLSEFTSF